MRRNHIQRQSREPVTARPTHPGWSPCTTPSEAPDLARHGPDGRGIRSVPSRHRSFGSVAGRSYRRRPILAGKVFGRSRSSKLVLVVAFPEYAKPRVREQGVCPRRIGRAATDSVSGRCGAASDFARSRSYTR
jgi:hypothetical protein